MTTYLVYGPELEQRLREERGWELASFTVSSPGYRHATGYAAKVELRRPSGTATFDTLVVKCRERHDAAALFDRYYSLLQETGGLH